MLSDCSGGSSQIRFQTFLSLFVKYRCDGNAISRLVCEMSENGEKSQSKFPKAQDATLNCLKQSKYIQMTLTEERRNQKIFIYLFSCIYL